MKEELELWILVIYFIAVVLAQAGRVNGTGEEASLRCKTVLVKSPDPLWNN